MSVFSLFSGRQVSVFSLFSIRLVSVFSLFSIRQVSVFSLLSIRQVSVFGGYCDERGDAMRNSMSLLTALHETDRILEVSTPTICLKQS